MREIKFRFLSPYTGKIVYEHDGWAEGIGINEAIKSSSVDYGYKIMQYTGLKDKNGVTEVYEGDIINADGLIIGNQYENPEILETGINLLIQGFGTEDWIDTHKEAMERGCKYA